MQVRKISEDSKTFTLAWDPVAGAEGYVFYRNGVRVSRTCDRKRTEAKFSRTMIASAPESVS